jgi:GrpB-like predicted nucleotidyltransferase (UPF0157 family)
MPLPAEKLFIAPYSASWQQLFNKEQNALATVFSDVPVRIKHIGSTAVKGLDARPIVDILVGVDTMSAIHSRISELLNIGYKYVAELEAEIPDRRFFYKSGRGRRICHLHCTCINYRFFSDRILFRDCLRRDDAIAQDYVRLKKNLCRTLHSDRVGYNDSKAAFINYILNQARKKYDRCNPGGGLNHEPSTHSRSDQSRHQRHKVKIFNLPLFPRRVPPYEQSE